MRGRGPGSRIQDKFSILINKNDDGGGGDFSPRKWRNHNSTVMKRKDGRVDGSVGEVIASQP